MSWLDSLLNNRKAQLRQERDVSGEEISRVHQDAEIRQAEANNITAKTNPFTSSYDSDVKFVGLDADRRPLSRAEYDRIRHETRARIELEQRALTDVFYETHPKIFDENGRLVQVLNKNYMKR